MIHPQGLLSSNALISVQADQLPEQVSGVLRKATVLPHVPLRIAADYFQMFSVPATNGTV